MNTAHDVQSVVVYRRTYALFALDDLIIYK